MSLKRPEPERGIETRLMLIGPQMSHRLKRPEPERGIETPLLDGACQARHV